MRWTALRQIALLFLIPAWRQVSAQEAKPAGEWILPESALPAYEREIDHAGLIRGESNAARQRGEKIYQQVCHNCHGDLNLPGSLPAALRFGDGKVQRGSDPFSIYQTLTRGWRQMPPQPELTPQEKYDVIHYLRATFLAPHNPTQLFTVTEDYLAGLPKGRSKGPAPVKREPWKRMDYGPFLIGTFELADDERRREAATGRSLPDTVRSGANIAYKGIAVRLDRGAGGVAAGRSWVVFEHDTLRLAGGWSGEGFIDWEGINFNGRHVVRPRTVGELDFETADGPGWANPATGRFDEARVGGADGRHFGPFPREWMRFRGIHRHGDRIVMSYTVGTASVLESHDREIVGGTAVVVRTLNVGKSERDLVVRVANAGTVVAVSGLSPESLANDERFVTLRIPAAATPVKLAMRMARRGGWEASIGSAPPPADLSVFIRGGPSLWGDVPQTSIVRSGDEGAFAWDRLTLPQANPWQARMRTSGIDFLPGGNAAVVCTWDGDVWRVEGLTLGGGVLTWRRMASGLFQPLGIKVRGGAVFVTCRDQLVRLRDLNGDGETDFYEAYNSDHQVTEHFHEFAMGLQADAAGNFYYAKSARHARTGLVPQHGTLLKIGADGATTEILANGFRAANGVCLNPDGSFFVTDQEGHWMPMNRINRVTPGRFFGNMWSGGAPADASDAAMAPPLCWIDKGFDRSPAELLWVERGAWSSLGGALLNLSYGRGRIEIVFSESAGEHFQGGVCPLPIPDFPTGIMRGRFHPNDGQLYLCGLSAWATDQTLQEGGLYRIRRTGAPAYLPIAWHVIRDGIELTFSEPPRRESLETPANFQLKVWDLQRSEKYGSPRINERPLSITQASVLDGDARVVRLAIPNLAPTACFELRCRLQDAAGRPFERVLTGTVHHVPGGSD